MATVLRTFNPWATVFLSSSIFVLVEIGLPVFMVPFYPKHILRALDACLPRRAVEIFVVLFLTMVVPFS